MEIKIMSSLYDFPLQQWKEDYNLEVMIETGTFEGKSIECVLKNGIDIVHSCDVQDFFERMKKKPKFLTNENVHLYIGKSMKYLPIMLENVGIDTNCLIFLDAHCDPRLFRNNLADVDTDDTDPVPMFKELSLILKHRDVSNDVLIIDDIHLYVHEVEVQRFDGWKTKLPSIQFQTINEMKHVIYKKLPNHNLEIVKVHDAAVLMTPK
jgi:hypothetical protein